MPIQTLLIANRGEIAIRIARAAAELGMCSIAIFSEDDAASLHVRKADQVCALRGRGAAAYLDIEQILQVAREAGCDAIHPGYGFLSENAQFARRCAEEGIRFVGPRPELLELFGDKVQARGLAERNRVPVIPGTVGATSLAQAHAFLASLGEGGAMMIKAVAGGGGRGMRAVYRSDEVEAAYARCQSEARASFGNGEVYAEQLMRRARHIEVQIIGDGSGRVSHLGERECTLQRRNQKLVEIAPSPTLSAVLRQRITAAAVQLAEAVRYDSLGTFEFLVDADEDEGRFAFIEANPRLQVEHTVTEEVSGVDLVKTQLQLAEGRSLADLHLTQVEIAPPRGYALQLRINMETMEADGAARPAGGTLSAFEAPSGPSIRVDSFGYAGYTTSPNFDSLLAKLITHSSSPRFEDVVLRAYRALCEFRIEGVATNLAFLQNLLKHPAVTVNQVHTRFVEEHIGELLDGDADAHRKLYFDEAGDPEAVSGELKSRAPAAPDNTSAIAAPMQGTVVTIDVHADEPVQRGQQVGVMEAMKMEHIIHADFSGIVRLIVVAKGDTLFHGQPLMYIEPAEMAASQAALAERADLDHVRPDLAEVRARHAIGLDAARPDAVARRRKTGQRTARENIDELCDAGSFIEYGALAIAAQRRRRPLEELIRISPADGLVAGVGAINGHWFDDAKARCMVMSYDYTVFAGTQGMMNHKKTDRMFQLAAQSQLPIVIFAEGGGGRPGDTDALLVAGLDVMSFINFAKLSGLVPRVGIVSGRCFAGNAAFLGCCDVIIATENATIGMGGPAMIEGGGLGVFSPEEVGPVSMQAPNGVIDVVVADEAAAVQAAKKYLSYFQGALPDWECADQRQLRHCIPENRLRVYDIRSVIDTLADMDSVLELRRQFGSGIVTALIRIEGRPLGLIANNPKHLGGAIDADAADKAARFMQLCDAFDLPILSLCDTPGFMVGPAAESTAMVRHVSRMFVTAGSISVPFFTIVLRKGYGLGAQAMAGGSFHAPFFTIAWPSGEFGAMGIDGAVRLGYRKELEAVVDPVERKALFDRMVADAYEQGKAINMASFLEIDEVIDPEQSRLWVMRGLRAAPPVPPRNGKKRPFVDTW